MTLLDTNAVIWAHMGHVRSRRLARVHGRRYVSPATLLELQMLVEAGRITLAGKTTVNDLVHDQEWLLDDPPAAAWFERATTISWTRDPFDRLIVAHAHLRGWRLATGDALLVERLGAQHALEL
jgi:PIN domain nuclease of toxin-antitoxin system